MVTGTGKRKNESDERGLGPVDGEVLWTNEWQVASELGQEWAIVEGVTQAFDEAGLEEPRLPEIASAVSEACLNAIEHGNRCDSELPVTVNLQVAADRYVFRVSDLGPGTNLEETAIKPMRVRDKIEWEQPRGWGVQLMRAYADRIIGRRTDDGFCVELQFYRQPVTDDAGGREEIH